MNNKGLGNYKGSRKVPAIGHATFNMKSVAVRFDFETFDEIRELAKDDGLSLAAKVIELVEWGLIEKRKDNYGG